MFSYAAATFISFSRRENFFSKLRSSLSSPGIRSHALRFRDFRKKRKGKKKGRRRGMKIPQPLNTIFHDDTGGSAQSTIRYSYVRGMRTACPNSAASFCGKIRAFRDRLNNNRPGLKRSNSSPGDIAVQKIYTEYVFLHRDFSFSLSFLLRLFNEGTVNYRAANRDGLAKSKTGWCEDLSISRITGEIILCSF